MDGNSEITSWDSLSPDDKHVLKFTLTNAANNKFQHLGAMKYCAEKQSRGGYDGGRQKSAWMKYEPSQRNYTTILFFLKKNTGWVLERIEGDCTPVMKIVRTIRDHHKVLVAIAKSPTIDVVTCTLKQRTLESLEKERAKKASVPKVTPKVVREDTPPPEESKPLTGADFGWSDTESDGD